MNAREFSAPKTTAPARFASLCIGTALFALAVVLPAAAAEPDAAAAAPVSQACPSLRDAHQRLQRAFELLLGFGTAGELAKRTEPGRPADADDWKPRASDAAATAEALVADGEGEGEVLEVALDATQVRRLLCGTRGRDAACAMCAWHVAQSLGHKVTFGSAHPALGSTADRFLARTLAQRQSLEQRVLVARAQ